MNKLTTAIALTIVLPAVAHAQAAQAPAPKAQCCEQMKDCCKGQSKMDCCKGMDHSKMSSQSMSGMDHSKMSRQDMSRMDHSKMGQQPDTKQAPANPK